MYLSIGIIPRVSRLEHPEESRLVRDGARSELWKGTTVASARARPKKEKAITTRATTLFIKS